MEPDLQALLAERAALALSLGVTVDEEVFFLEDLLLEVQLLREEQRRRSAACLAAPDAPSAAVAAPDASSSVPVAPGAPSSAPTALDAPSAGPAAPGAPSAEDAEAQALLHEVRQAERAFATLEKQSPDGVLALGSSALLQQRFTEACRALVRLLLRAPERGAEQQLWKLHHRVADAHQRAVRGLAAMAARQPLPAGAPPPAELAAACAALETFLRDAGALYSALIAAVDPPLSASLAAEAAATTAAAAPTAPPPVAVRVLSRPSERAERNEGGERGEGGPPAHHPLVDPAAAAAMVARLSRTAVAALAAHCCLARGDLFRYAAQLPLVASATARRDAAAGARRHYAAAARLRPAEGRPHIQIALLSAAAPGSALETIYRYARALGCAPAWPKCPGSQLGALAASHRSTAPPLAQG